MSCRVTPLVERKGPNFAQGNSMSFGPASAKAARKVRPKRCRRAWRRTSVANRFTIRMPWARCVCRFPAPPMPSECHAMVDTQDNRVLVVGATGQLGGVITSKLSAAGVPVRALARRRDKLEALAAPGVELAAIDLLDLAKLTEACRGISQIIATANNNMGKGATSPMRVDLAGYQNLCAAVRNTGVRRLLYVSFRGASPHGPVDIFRLKWHIEDVIRRSG